MPELDLDQPLHQQIEEARTAAASEVPRDVRRYYDGDHDEVVSYEALNSLGERASRRFMENILKRCVDTLAGRLLFRRFLCEDDDRVQDWLNGFAAKNHMANLIVANSVRTIVDGSHTLSLSWERQRDDEAIGRPVVHQDAWWDGEEGMFANLDTEGIATWAVKEWTNRAGRKRRTVYLPDQIIRYVREGEAWQPYPDEATHRSPWVKRDGSPLGVPVVYFGNNATGDGRYGTSTVEPLLGLQDALNGTIFDIVAAGAMSALPIYTARGVSRDDRLTVGPGRLWQTQASPSDVEFGQLPGGSMEALLDEYRTVRDSIANSFPVAHHLVTGSEVRSGAALIQLQAPMISQVKLMGDTFAPSWVRLAHRATEMQNAFGRDEAMDEDALVRVEYDPPEQLDEGTVAQIDRERVGLYRDLVDLPKTLMLKTGLVNADEADAIIAERGRRMTAMLSDFDRGAFGADDYGEGTGS